jgi:1-phosphofructokinase
VQTVLTVTLNPALDRALEVPGFRVGVHARARLKSILPSGKGVNVARGVVRLGGRAVACALVGADEVRLYEESLRADGVEARLCPVEGRTRMNTTVLDPEARTTTHLREEGFRVGADDLARLRAALGALLETHPGSPVVFSGSLPVGMAPKDLAVLLAEAARAGARVVVDTNGPALQAAVATGLVHTLKPNLSELEECLGESLAPDSAAAAARRLLGRVRTILLTLGEQGAYLVERGMTCGWRCPLRPDEVGNNVGSGDAFMAGWLRGRQVADDPAEALRWAVAAGAACARSESTIGYRMADVQELLPRCVPLAEAAG